MRLLLGVGSTIAAMLFVPVASQADETDDAIAFLTATLECPLSAEESTNSEGWFTAKKAKNSFNGDARRFSVVEKYTLTEGQTGGESYETDNHNEILANFSDLRAEPGRGSEVQVACVSGKQCITVKEVMNSDMELQSDAMAEDPMDCFHEGMCRTEESKAVSAVTLKVCNVDAVRDLVEVVQFLAAK